MLFNRLFLLISLLFTLNSAIQAQILNVERTRARVDTAGWHGQIQLNASLSQYSERIMELSNASNLSYFSRKHAYMLLNKINAVNLNGRSLISSGYVHLRATFQRTKPLSPEAFLQYQYNNNLGLENRTVAGAGLLYTFYENDQFTASFSSGVMSEYERWKNSNDQVTENQLLKSTNNLMLRGQISPTSSFVLIGYYQFRPDEFLSARSILESQLSAQVNDHISLSLSFSSSYDASPVIQTQEWVYELKNGISISF